MIRLSDRSYSTTRGFYMLMFGDGQAERGSKLPWLTFQEVTLIMSNPLVMLELLSLNHVMHTLMLMTTLSQLLGVLMTGFASAGGSASPYMSTPCSRHAQGQDALIKSCKTDAQTNTHMDRHRTHRTRTDTGKQTLTFLSTAFKASRQTHRQANIWTYKKKRLQTENSDRH